MIVVDSVPVVWFTAGEAVAPEDVNHTFQYLQDALADVSEKRFAIGSVTMPFVISVMNGVSNISSDGLKTYRFRAPFPCTILRCFLDGDLTSTARLDVDIVEAGTSIRPTGATIPLLSLPTQTDGTIDVNDINVNKVQLLKDTTYELTLSGGGTFSTQRLDLTLHIAVDRYMFSGSMADPQFAFRQFVDGVASGDDIATIESDYTLAVNNLINSIGRACFHLTQADFNSGTVPELLSKMIPSFSNSRANARIERIILTSYVETVGAIGVTATLKNAALATVATVTTSHASAKMVTQDSGVLSVPLSSLTGDASDSADDLTLEFSTTAPGGNPCVRASALVWVRW